MIRIFERFLRIVIWLVVWDHYCWAIIQLMIYCRFYFFFYLSICIFIKNICFHTYWSFIFVWTFCLNQKICLSIHWTWWIKFWKIWLLSCLKLWLEHLLWLLFISFVWWKLISTTLLTFKIFTRLFCKFFNRTVINIF